MNFDNNKKEISSFFSGCLKKKRIFIFIVIIIIIFLTLRLVASVRSLKHFNWELLLGAENSHNLFVSTQKHARNGRMMISFSN